MNMTLYGYAGRWVAVDCGMALRQELPNTPLQLPDIAPLKQAGIAPDALIITHGHEDHIGAVTWLWPHWGCPIWASPLAAAMLRYRFAERGLSTSAIQVFSPSDAFEVGEFTFRPLPITHSIPESCALLMQTPAHRILHTGDWKLDPAPLLGPAVSEGQFRALAPVELVIGDSTNAMEPGHSLSEADVARTLEKTIAACTGRVVVSCFASNLARIYAAAQAAQACGRRIALAGRAMQRMVHIARGLGYFEDFPPIIPMRDIGYLPREEVMVIATGSQGERRAAVSRMAHQTHHDLDLEAGDTVIFSSKVIPGNEVAINTLCDALRRRGISVLDEQQDPSLHASGHPAIDELNTLYDWVQPGYLLPVHGTLEHQQAHLAVAHRRGIRGEHCPTDGEWLQWDQQQLTLHKTLPVTERIVDQQQTPAASSQRRARHALTVIIPVAAHPSGWTRIGRAVIDPPPGLQLDDSSLVEWMDEYLAYLPLMPLEQSRQRMVAALKHHLFERGLTIGFVYLDMFDTAAS